MPTSASTEEETDTYPRTGRFMAGRLRGELSEEEKRVLENAVEEVVTHDRALRVLERGKVYNQSTVLIDGFMMRTIDGADGRHSVSIHVPGDFVDLHCFALKRLDHNLDTVGPTVLGFVPHGTLAAIVAERPHLTRILWFATLADAAIHREWVMKLEQLTVPRRLAHIFAETWHRLEMVGLGRDDGFDLPLTQSDLGEMVGATTIHVNRALKELRENGIVRFAKGTIAVEDRERLIEFARFSPEYLYGDGPLAVRSGFG